MSPAASAVDVPKKHLFEERHAWLGLALTPGIGPRRLLRAVDRCGSAARVLHLPLTELEGLEMPAQSAQFIASG